LGIMIYTISIGLWVLSFSHIIIHAFFKSILFLRTGSLIAQAEGVQDSRFYGSSFFSYSSFVFFITRCLSLSGFPFFIGFYSKDLIISIRSLTSGFFYYCLFLLGCTFTVGYRIRLVYERYFKLYKSFNFLSYNESNYFFIPVILLFFKCWILGGTFYWFFFIDIKFVILFIDLFSGILVLFFGFLLFNFLKIYYYIYFMFNYIAFIKWKSSRGSSLTIKNIKIFEGYELSWMEFWGGSGMFELIWFTNKNIIFIKSIPMGILFLITIFVITFYLY
jgi:NADH:ubiquinone oxidoreductase subunit 5 (subunit L)/multisubunit Na+/H+ antiporter MnhA subunit